MPFPLDADTRGFITDHFRRKHLEWTEDYFIRVLDSPNKHDVYWATIALRGPGTLRSVPHLEAKLGHPMRDVKCTALLTIAHIAGAGLTPRYAELLNSSAYREKAYAMWAIMDAADERAVEGVVAYLKRNRGRLMAGELTNGTLPFAVAYLSRHAGRADVDAARDDVRRAWTLLPSRTRTDVLAHSPGFVP